MQQDSITIALGQIPSVKYLYQRTLGLYALYAGHMLTCDTHFIVFPVGGEVFNGCPGSVYMRRPGRGTFPADLLAELVVVAEGLESHRYTEEDKQVLADTGLYLIDVLTHADFSEIETGSEEVRGMRLSNRNELG